MSDQSNNGSDADVRGRLVDPRNDPRGLRFDAAFAAETDRLSQQVWGSGRGAQPAGGSSPSAPPAGSGGYQLPTQADLRARDADPRGDPRSIKFDRDFAAETDRLYQQVYGGGSPDGTSHPNQPASGPADQVPADIKGYTLGNSEKLAPHVRELEGDALYNEARTLARQAGLSQKQFATFLTPVLEKLAERSAGPGVDFDKEWRKLVPDDARDRDEQAQRVAAGRRIEAALDFVEHDAVSAGLDPKVAAYLVEHLGENELGVRAIEWFSGRGHGRH